MTRKHFELVAGALRCSRPDVSDNSPAGLAAREAWATACINVAESLRRSHANFDRKRFIVACGVLEPRA